MRFARQPADAPRLLWTLAALMATSLPHLTHLPPWAMLLLAATVAWRLAVLHGRFRLPGMVVRLALAVTGFAGVLLTYKSINGLEAGSALLVVMSALKLTETRQVRDLLILVLISYFLIVTQFLFEQSVATAVFSVPAVWLVTTALLQIASPAPPLPWRRALSRSGLLLAQAAPLMLIAFILFPRFSGPFWAIPRAQESAITGISDSMSPGSITQLLQSDAVAFRVRFDAEPPAPARRYWRGLVLSNFDGRTWSVFQARDRALAPDSVQRVGPATGYEITLEPHQQAWLFALEQPDPATLPRASYMTNDRRLLRNRPVTQLYQYRLESWPQYLAGRDNSPWELQRDRQFDAQRNPRTQRLAQRWAREADDHAVIVARALSMFREQPFRYTLTPPALTGPDPVDEFLMSSRNGFCEHYASAFTLLMRAAGVPARVVVGYQGGEINPFTGHMTVRQSDAHAWSEVWLSGKGWQRVDPTAAVAPERVELGVAASLPAGESLPGLFRSHAWLQQMKLGLDAFNNGWNEWVLGFSRDKQIDLLELLGMNNPSLRKMLLTMIGLFALVLAALALQLLWQARPARSDPVSRLYRRFCRRVEPESGPRRPNEGPRDFAARVGRERPDLADAVEAVTSLYLELRYYPDAPGDERFRRAVRTLRT